MTKFINMYLFFHFCVFFQVTESLKFYIGKYLDLFSIVIIVILCLKSHIQLKTIFIHIFFLLLMGFLCVSAGKESACNAGDLDSVPGLGRSLGEGKDYPLQYSDLENS